MDQYKEQILTFLQDRWVVVALVIIAIIVIIKVVKSVVKWLLIIVLAAAIIIYGFNYTGVGALAAKMMGQSSTAQYEEQAGHYTVTSGDFTLSGTVGSDEAELSYKGLSLKITLSDALDAFVAGAKATQTKKE